MKVRDVRGLFDRHNFRPNKKLGQIFLMDENILKKLSSTLDIKDSEYILEIGPGFGNLTRCLLEKAKKVFVVEKDARLCDMMKEYLKDNPSRYPQYGGLRVDKTESALNFNFMTWEEIIDDLAKQL